MNYIRMLKIVMTSLKTKMMRNRMRQMRRMKMKKTNLLIVRLVSLWKLHLKVDLRGSTKNWAEEPIK